MKIQNRFLTAAVLAFGLGAGTAQAALLDVNTDDPFMTGTGELAYLVETGGYSVSIVGMDGTKSLAVIGDASLGFALNVGDTATFDDLIGVSVDMALELSDTGTDTGQILFDVVANSFAGVTADQMLLTLVGEVSPYSAGDTDFATKVDFTLSPVVIPLPASALLLGSALGLVALRRKT